MNTIYKAESIASGWRRVMLSVAVAVAGLSGMTAQNTIREDHSFNALDYVLQKPAANELFSPKKLGDHMFITGEGGATWMHSPRQFIGHPESGVRAGIAVGDWFTPVHGWKIGINTGRHKNSVSGAYYFGGISVDYLMNLSALAGKYDPYRKFEFIGVAGVEYQMLFRHGSKWGAAGAHIGLQARYNVTPSTFVYVEPRFGIYSDGVDGVRTWQRYDWEASVMVGFGYRLSGARPRWTATLDNDRFVNNTFYGVSAGAISLVQSGMFSNLSKRIGPSFSMFVGKWASSISGWRISATAGTFGNRDNGHTKYAMAELDYLWNINSAFAGFNPSAPVQTNIGIGAILAGTSRSGRKIYPGLGLSFQVLWNVTSNIGLYAEPRARIFNDNIVHTGEPLDVMASFNIGLQYKFGKYNDPLFKYNTMEAYKAFAPTKKYFMTIGGGIFGRRGVYRHNLAGYVGIGKWFTPVSAWRITADYEYYRNPDKTMSLALSADYMLSLSSMVADYDPGRVFDLIAEVGVYGGLGNYSHRNKIIYGLKGGLQGRFNVSKSIDIFLEPQLLALKLPGYRGGGITPDLRFMIGLNYKLGGRDDRDRQDIYSSTDNDKRNFVSLSAGPSFFSETVLHNSTRRVSGAMDAAVGRWFSASSGGRIGVSYDFIHTPWNHRGASIGTLHADYMLNFTKLFEGDRDQTFNFIGFVGAGMGWSDRSKDGVGVAVEGGAQFRLSLIKDVDFYAEPIMTLWHRKLYPFGINNHQFVGVGRLMIGAAYRF